MNIGRNPLCLLVALVAVLCQPVLGQAAHAAASQPGAVHICGVPADHRTPSPHGMDCVQCALCAGLASAMLPPPVPELPSAASARIERPARLAAFDAPPPPSVGAAHPRGPPALS